MQNRYPLFRLLLVWAAGWALVNSGQAQEIARWDAAKANQWYEQQPWLVGANFIPSDAINELEMFQTVSFNPALNDKELGMAEAIGMNTMRVFLQDQVWLRDPDSARKTIDDDRSQTSHTAYSCPLRFVLGA